MLYGQRVLNSGLNLNGIGFEPGVFSFLKLHGSVGMWITDFPGDPIYGQRGPGDRGSLTVDDHLFFPAEPATQGPTRSIREPLLFFPNQRQFILSKESGFVFHKYANAVWDRAKELIENATEIHVIGYSFSGIDRGPVLDLLETDLICRRLIIQGPDAERICGRLKIDRPRLRDLIEPAPFKF